MLDLQIVTTFSRRPVHFLSSMLASSFWTVVALLAWSVQSKPLSPEWTVDREPRQGFGTYAGSSIAIADDVAFIVERIFPSYPDRPRSLGTLRRIDFAMGKKSPPVPVAVDPEDPFFDGDLMFYTKRVRARPDGTLAFLVTGTNFDTPKVVGIHRESGKTDEFYMALSYRDGILLPPLGDVGVASTPRIIPVAEVSKVDWFDFAADGRLHVLTRTFEFADESNESERSVRLVHPDKRVAESAAEPSRTRFRLYAIATNTREPTLESEWTADGIHRFRAISPDRTKVVTEAEGSNLVSMPRNQHCYDTETQKMTRLDIGERTAISRFLMLDECEVAYVTQYSDERFGEAIAEIRRIALDGSAPLVLTGDLAGLSDREVSLSTSDGGQTIDYVGLSEDRRRTAFTQAMSQTLHRFRIANAPAKPDLTLAVQATPIAEIVEPYLLAELHHELGGRKRGSFPYRLFTTFYETPEGGCVLVRLNEEDRSVSWRFYPREKLDTRSNPIAIPANPTARP